jgi:hypothetical protein
MEKLLDFGAASPDGSFDMESKLMVKPRKAARPAAGRWKPANGPFFETQHENDDGTFVKLESADMVRLRYFHSPTY